MHLSCLENRLPDPTLGYTTLGYKSTSLYTSTLENSEVKLFRTTETDKALYYKFTFIIFFPKFFAACQISCECFTSGQADSVKIEKEMHSIYTISIKTPQTIHEIDNLRCNRFGTVSDIKICHRDGLNKILGTLTSQLPQKALV